MCNCSSNPCSCANANCSCPPDYTIQPATLNCSGTVCDDSLLTDCVFTTGYLSCINANSGDSLQSVLQKMDSKICQGGGCSGATDIPLYYVDSHNPNNGDGSVSNPFKTLDLAYSAIIGSGSVNIPNHPLETIQVQPGDYTTSINIYIPSITWTFQKGATVTFTGDKTYFIDSYVGNVGSLNFYVVGYLEFYTSTGGFVKNSGIAVNGGANKNIFIECFSVTSVTSVGSVPVISSDPGGSPISYNIPVSLSIRLIGQQSFITSTYQTVISFTGGYVFIDLQGGIISYNGGNAGTILQYNVTDTNPQVAFRLENGYIYGYTIGASALMTLYGNINYFVIDNIKSTNPGIALTKPDTFIYMYHGLATLSLGGSDIFTFLLKNVYLTRDCFGTDNTIVYGSTGPTDNMTFLQMQNCVLELNCSLVPSTNILPYLGLYASGSNPVVCYNIINGKMHVTNLPTSNPGLGSGYLWSNSGVVQVA